MKLYLVFLLLLTTSCEAISELKTTPPQGQKSSQVWTVQRVSDGDTLTILRGLEKQKIRLCGIDAPEKNQPLGRESSDFVRSLIAQSNNKVIVVPTQSDRYGRTVAEVFVILPDGSEKFLQEELILAGLAYHYAQYSSRCPNRNAIVEAEAIARSQKVGVWRGFHVPPWEHRRKNRTN